MDISKLIVKQTFLIPKQKEKLSALVLRELNKVPIKAGKFNILEWYIDEEYKKSVHFFRDTSYSYLKLKEPFETPDPEKKIEELLLELAQMNARDADRYVEKRLENCRPYKITMDIINEDKQCYRVEVECLPTLYFNITKNKMTNYGDYEIQDSNLVSQRFLKTIFIGALNGTLVSDVPQITTQNPTMVLINDVKSHQITEKIEDTLKNATGEVLIVAWMGTILLTVLRTLKEKGVIIKVITGLTKDIRQDVMQREKEKAFEELISILGKENICLKRDFHGRAIVIDDKAFVGSIDLDSYSLTGARQEFAMYTEDVDAVRTIRNYFNCIFEPMKS